MCISCTICNVLSNQMTLQLFLCESNEDAYEYALYM